MVSAGVYARISDDRAGSGLGVARQEQDCRALVEQRGWTLAEIYVDNDLSASNGKRRPAYERMLGDLDARRIGAVVAWHPDRLYRRTVDLVGFISVIERTGALVATVQAGDLDLSTASGRMVARILGSVAEHEVEHKAERQRRKAEELAHAGKVGGGGTRPYGFEDDRVSLRETEAEVIRELARRVLVGETVRGLCADMERRGISTVTGTPWAPFTLKRMITSPRVAGLRQHRGEVVGDAVWPGIVDRATWETCRRILLDPGREKRTMPSRSYLLTGGMARCGLCDAALVARPRQDKRRCYVCARGPGYSGCGKIRSLADPLEDLVVDAVLVALDGPALASARSQVGGAMHPATDAAVDLAEVERRLDELAEMFAGGEIGRREWLTARKRLEARRDALSARLGASVLSPLAAIKGDVDESWNRLNFDQRRAVIGAVLDRVIVGPAVRGRNRFDPERVSFVWRA